VTMHLECIIANLPGRQWMSQPGEKERRVNRRGAN
jgi:hypothetical protein